MSLPFDDTNEFRKAHWGRELHAHADFRAVGPDWKNPKRLAENLGFIMTRLKAVEAALKAEFVGKEEIIKMMIVCAIAQQPMLLIGTPGTAKSRLVTRMCELLGIKRAGLAAGEEGERQTSFQYLLHGFTEPDEILGILDLAAYKGGEGGRPRFARLREGSITDAEVIFLDEVFRANSAILNSLLTIINERRVYEGGGAVKAKARLIYGASNGPPSPREREELAAFYSRFIIRMESAQIRSPSSFELTSKERHAREDLLVRGWDNEVRDSRAEFDPDRSALKAVSFLNDILFCNRCVTEFWGGEDWRRGPETNKMVAFVRMYHNLVVRLMHAANNPCIIDDRKFIRLFVVLRAHALYTHQDVPDASDLEVLKHIWEAPSDFHRLHEIVDQFIEEQKPAAPAPTRIPV